MLPQGAFTLVLFSVAELHEGLFSSLVGLCRCECNNCTQVCTNINAERWFHFQMNHQTQPLEELRTFGLNQLEPGVSLEFFELLIRIPLNQRAL